MGPCPLLYGSLQLGVAQAPVPGREVFQIGPKFLVKFFDTVLLSAHVERVSVSRMRDFLPTILIYVVMLNYSWNNITMFLQCSSIQGTRFWFLLKCIEARMSEGNVDSCLSKRISGTGKVVFCRTKGCFCFLIRYKYLYCLYGKYWSNVFFRAAGIAKLYFH